MATLRNIDADEGSALRPLSARSLMLSLLLGMHPPRLPAAELVRWCELFGVESGAARTALSRMAASGEVRRHDGAYELAGTALDRQRRQDRAIEVAAPATAWDGTWWVAVVTAADRDAPARARLRAEMAREHFAEQREGVWTRPANRGDAAGEEQRGQTYRWRARPEGDPVALAAALWDLRGWASAARHAVDRLERASRSLARAGSGAIPDAFLAGAGALVQVRADPRLPAELLPRDWPGDALRDAYRAYQPQFTAAARAWRRGGS